MRLRRAARTGLTLFFGAFMFAALVSGRPGDGRVVLRGTVVDQDGRGIAGVVVNNGREFCQTDRTGAWRLPTDSMLSKFVSICTPREYRLPAAGGIASGYYIPVKEAFEHRADNRFTLWRRDSVARRFHYIAVSDPQILNAHDLKRWRNETVPSIMRTAAQLRKTGEVVGMVLGDLVFDNMRMYPRYAASLSNRRMTFFQCIGNHDFDKASASLSNCETGAADYAERLFGQYFGPTCYSFDIAQAHIVTMKSIDYHGACRYEERLTDDELEWLERDLSYVPKDRLVILNMHAPAWNLMEPVDNIENAERLKEILAPYNAHVFAGHTHFFENVELSPRLYQHNIAAACGAWWTSNVNRDGAPNGYLTADIDGTSMTWTYRATGSKTDVQMRVYKPGQFRGQAAYVVANVWDWDPHCRVVWYEDGKYKGYMQQFTADDEAFMQTKPRKQQMAKTRHLFRARPSSDKYRRIKVILINRFGQTYSHTIENLNNRPFLLDK